MESNNNTDRYIKYINDRILPFIDYPKLQASYNTDMVYAKGVLNRLHEAMAEVYGSEQLDEDNGDEGFVVIPGVLCGRDTGKICLALLDLDLSSSGEHWGTAFLVGSGVISQSEAYSKDGGEAAAEMKKAIAPYGSYDYCYTAEIPDDIHVSTDRMPEALLDVLKDFHNHRALLTNERQKKPRNKTSVEDRLRAAQEKIDAQTGKNTPDNQNKKRNDPVVD